MIKYQFTLFDKQNRYRPISTIVTPRHSKETIKEMRERAIYKLRTDRGWSEKELLVKYGYNTCKFRAVNEKGIPLINVKKV